METACCGPPVSAHASGAVTLVDHAHAEVDAGQSWCRAVNVISVVSWSVCVFLKHNADGWVLVMLAEDRCCVRGHVLHLNSALCDIAWGYARAGCSSVAISVQYREEMERPQSLHPDFPLKPQSASIPSSTFQLSSLKMK